MLPLPHTKPSPRTRKQNWKLYKVYWYDDGSYWLDSTSKMRNFGLFNEDDDKVRETYYKNEEARNRKIIIDWMQKDGMPSRHKMLHEVQLLLVPKRKITTLDTFTIAFKNTTQSQMVIDNPKNLKKIYGLNHDSKHDSIFKNFINLYKQPAKPGDIWKIGIFSSDTTVGCNTKTLVAFHEVALGICGSCIKGIIPSSMLQNNENNKQNIDSLIVKSTEYWRKILPLDSSNTDHMQNIIIRNDTMELENKQTENHNNYWFSFTKILLTNSEKYVDIYLGEIPKNVHYSYKILPYFTYSDSSIKSIDLPYGEHKIRLQNLWPDRYLLRISNSSNPMECTEYQLIVEPKWWQKTWVIIGFATLFVFGIGYYFYKKTKRKHSQKIGTITSEKNKTQLNLDHIRAQLNPHFIFNSLQSLQNIIQKNDNQNALKFIQNLSILLRKPLDPKAYKHWSLADELEALENYINLEKYRTEINFDKKIIGNEALDNIPFPCLLLQPIIENCIKHFTKSPEILQINMQITMQNTKLTILIQDNGQWPTTQVQQGIGLDITNQYMALIAQQYPASQCSFVIEPQANNTKFIFTFDNYLDA